MTTDLIPRDRSTFLFAAIHVNSILQRPTSLPCASLHSPRSDKSTHCRPSTVTPPTTTHLNIDTFPSKIAARGSPSAGNTIDLLSMYGVYRQGGHHETHPHQPRKSLTRHPGLHRQFLLGQPDLGLPEVSTVELM